MRTSGIVLIVVLVLVGYFLWRKFAKPTAITHDSTILFTGGLGSGKSLNSVKFAIKQFRRNHFRWWLSCRWIDFKKKIFVGNSYSYPEEPRFKSNLPVRIGGTSKNPKFCDILTRDDLTLKTRIPEKSVVLLDELPQFINQYQWENKEVQGVLNEFITFFRHYVDGLLVCNAQSLDEVEVHVRRKLNAYYYCFDFQPFLFFFYRCHILKCRIGDQSVSLTADYVDDNAKWHYGILRNLYDSRCYRHRYDKVRVLNVSAFDDFTTNKILRFDKRYVSPLDDREVSNNGVSR